MPTSLDALTTLDLALIAAVAILSLVSGGLALRLQASPQASPPDASQDHSDTLDALQEQIKAAQAESKQYQQQLKAAQAESKQYQQQLKAAQAESKQYQQQLKAAQAESKNTREEAELTLLQLHQVQEELEHYFLLSREQNALLDGHAHQQKRVQKLLNTVISAQTPSASATEAVA
jgi:chromosome segregation ATPase